jgi:hypothetical protein
MSARGRTAFGTGTALDSVVEVPLLLAGREIILLEREAHRRDVTAAQLVRALIRRFVRRQQSPRWGR